MTSARAGWAVAGLLLFAALLLSLPHWTVRSMGRMHSSIAAEPTESSLPGNEAPTRVVIVGAGISGLSAALELGRGGSEVTVVDMSSVFGGHAVMSQGGLSIVDTPLQREAGISDSPQLAYDDFIGWGEDASAEWVRYYVDHSQSEIHDWLTELGVRFESVLPAPGNSVDRFHQPAGRGIGLVTPIYLECLKHQNVRFLWNLQVTGLRVEDGQVTGVEARQLRTERELTLPSEAVILATGGFQSNLEMVREFWPRTVPFPERILAGSGRNSVGHGHRLAEAAGGKLEYMDHQWNYFTGIPDLREPESNRGLSAANMYGILVNAEGRRFANLHNWAKDVMPPMLQQKQATVWWIFDEASKRQFSVSGSDWANFEKVQKLILNNPQLVHQADTIEELAEKSGLPGAELQATLDRYNGMVEQGVDEDFHRFGPERTEFNRVASPMINSPPYFAMQSWPLTRKSMGGVAIDLQCRVVDLQGETIPGLYAVGELTGLALINGRSALEGTFLGPCIITGRVAARSILGRSKISDVPDLQDASEQKLRGSGSSERCQDCHDVASLLESPRDGFWHFEKSHQLALERRIDCLECHAELAPYREDDHRIQPASLSSSCVRCHVAQE